MMKPIFATLALSLLPTLAMAGPQYSAEEISKHFSTPKAAVQCQPGQECLPKKDARGVCVGTSSKCGSARTETAQAAAPSAFDLLITFELGSDRLSVQAEQNLAEFARAMQGDALRSAQFNVDGHTDASGSDAFNQTLSQRRAASVVRFLEAQGIDSSRLTAQGHGESSPRSSDPFAAVNRRVEATVRVQ